jgi:hypothetical protein
MLTSSFDRIVLVMVVGLLVACDTNPMSAIKDIPIPDVLGQAENRENLKKITPDANIPIFLSSNRQDTTFTVNGVTLDKAKFMKVLVPKTDLRITARAPCYRLKEQATGADGFGDSSHFNFLFSNWDKDPQSKSRNCT